ncbi:Starch-binding associating with outer membrane [Belliella buryatensis]|uniref:Starch-binding associating with outer membrane n=1 Tax=Belliella buryatensis TaxID=1500549 RepID=A0A239DUU1_9BACT|nr:RagB/SusD family nutrient uptake outer membrane protein [Belliella buryatensis]SNS35512.1 Starch-binding associating with outer membrane [Belliella buryatensis]
MKNIFKILALGSALTVASSSCSDLLDTEPRQSLTTQIAFADAEGYQSLLFSAYGGLRGFGVYGQTLIVAPDVMADNLRIIANTGRYIGQEQNADRAHIGLWGTGYFSTINDTNIIIDAIDDPDLPGSQALKNRVKGEALAIRALLYHNHAKVYGYEPGREVNGWNLTTILRTTPTLGFSNADFRARVTNTELYAQMEADLLAAIPLLPTAAVGSSGVYRISKGAAEALLARIYLYGGKNAEAAAMASQAMTTFGLGNDGSGLLTPANYVSAFSTAPNPESIFEVEIRAVDWSGVDGVNNSVCSLVANVFPSAQFILTATQDLLDKYEEGDVRRNTWIQTTRTGSPEVVFRSAKWLGHKGDFLENLPIMRASELYLTRAEARQKTGDNAGARADINALRSRRGLGPVAADLSGNALFNKIMDERRIELVLEGHRFFDLKRNGMPITKGGRFEDLPYNDYRLLAPLPLAQLQLNELLVDNPGYN